ncbi:MAG TPA: tetratricopeptide repeat protein, partial [Nitrososphaeraceae archaeon]|nr:tetratricopeptide repeat protein [Nitrososphaeraceae archaeon]
MGNLVINNKQAFKSLNKLTKYTIILSGLLLNAGLLHQIFAEDEDRKQDKINNKNNNNQLLDILGNQEVSKIFNQGLELDSQGRYEEAIVYYDKALELDPQDRNSLVYKGLALFYLGKYEEALSWYDKVLEILPYDSYVLDDKGTVLLSMGNYHEAITLFDK